MAEIVLSDYLAFVFSEISRARDIADRYSKEIALLYAKDDVLRHFSVPRFKLSKLELNMPILVSSVEVSSVTKFQMTRDAFRSSVIGMLVEEVAFVQTSNPGSGADPVKGTDVPRPIRTEGIEPSIDVFFDQLVALRDFSGAKDIISNNWIEVSTKILAINGFPVELTKARPVSGLIARFLPAVIEMINSNLSVPEAAIQKLHINPQTNVVKDGSTDMTVFTIKAELMEEGIIVKSVRDDKTGAESPVVEFE
jgi:hypothetical protein